MLILLVDNCLGTVWHCLTRYCLDSVYFRICIERSRGSKSNSWSVIWMFLFLFEEQWYSYICLSELRRLNRECVSCYLQQYMMTSVGTASAGQSQRIWVKSWEFNIKHKVLYGISWNISWAGKHKLMYEYLIFLSFSRFANTYNKKTIVSEILFLQFLSSYIIKT